jgi:hypothetical protein
LLCISTHQAGRNQRLCTCFNNRYKLLLRIDRRCSSIH